ncbi:MAG: hypothetical protein J2P26_04855 [Nocardiopsaceae bacterium]|nr:hypothetical protein [Nocardiopsaceae bacterium]
MHERYSPAESDGPDEGALRGDIINTDPALFPEFVLTLCSGDSIEAVWVGPDGEPGGSANGDRYAIWAPSTGERLLGLCVFHPEASLESRWSITPPRPDRPGAYGNVFDAVLALVGPGVVHAPGVE